VRGQQTTINDDEHNCKNAAINQRKKIVVKTARMIHERKQKRAKLTTPLCSKAKDTHNTEQFQFIK